MIANISLCSNTLVCPPSSMTLCQVPGAVPQDIDLGEGLVLRPDGSIYSVKHGYRIGTIATVTGRAEDRGEDYQRILAEVKEEAGKEGIAGEDEMGGEYVIWRKSHAGGWEVCSW